MAAPVEAPAIAFDPRGSLFSPPCRVETHEGVQVLLDPDRAHWISVNEPGLRLLQEADGKTGTELIEAAGHEPGSKGERRVLRFLKQAEKRGFLSNEPFVPTDYTGRAPRLKPARLHEFWVLTNDDCNLRCRHCYTIDRVIKGDKGLPGETLRAIIDEARDLGAEVFYFTGGEPFRRDDIFELVEFVASRSKLIIFTNGTMIDDEVAQRLAPWAERLIFQISLDGDGEDNTVKVRGRTAFDRAYVGIQCLLRAGLRVGVSSTPTGAAYQSIPDLTERLARLEVGGRRVEFHHLIMLLDQGGAAQNDDDMGIGYEQFSQVLQDCRGRIQRVKREDKGCRLVIANDKMFKALASHGPRKDLCGAGYTILGMTADGFLNPCAATINDAKYQCGRLLETDGSYRPGRLTHLWWNDPQLERIRRYTLARRAGESTQDLRFFHGGGCWYNMSDPESAFSEAHPFAQVYEDFTLQEILKLAVKGVDEISSEAPELYNFMHRQRIACAGERKVEEVGEGGVDNGYCICFA